MSEVVNQLSDGCERTDRRPRGSGVMGRKLIGVLLAILSVMLLADAAAALGISPTTADRHAKQ